MEVSIWMVVITLAVAAGPYYAGSRFSKKDTDAIVRQAEELATKVIEDARREGETITKEAELKSKNAAIEAKEEYESEMREKKRRISRISRSALCKRKRILTRRLPFLTRKSWIS